MKIIIGLGNVGDEYVGTRHNTGWAVLDRIAKEIEVEFKFDKKINAEIAKGKLEGKPVILVKPWTFVNKSGEVARKLVKNKSALVNFILVHDDLDIEFGRFKLSFGKDAGGHRGVDSVIKAVKSNKFWRLKIGTANKKLVAARNQNTPKSRNQAIADFVLGKFSPAEQDELKKIIKQSIERLVSL